MVAAASASAESIGAEQLLHLSIPVFMSSLHLGHGKLRSRSVSMDYSFASSITRSCGLCSSRTDTNKVSSRVGNRGGRVLFRETLPNLPCLVRARRLTCACRQTVPHHCR